MKKKFRDFRCFGGFLTVCYRPCLLIWWSQDGTPPCADNGGRWIVGSFSKFALKYQG